MTIQETIKTIDEPKGWLKITPSDIRNLNDYCKKLESENQQLILSGVVNWVTLESNIKPNEDTEECLVKYEDGKVRTALFYQEDFRFYNSANTQDISEMIKAYAELPK